MFQPATAPVCANDNHISVTTQEAFGDNASRRNQSGIAPECVRCCDCLALVDRPDACPWEAPDGALFWLCRTCCFYCHPAVKPAPEPILAQGPTL